MTKKYLIVSLLVLFFSASLTSCSSDNDNNNNNNNNSGEAYGTSTGDYWPMAIGNQWTMKQNGMNAQPLKIVSTDDFNGTTYFKTSGELEDVPIDFNVQTWIAKKGATYINKIGEINYTQNGVTIKMQGFECTALKDDLPVGGTWTQQTSQQVVSSYQGTNQTFKMVTNFTGTILEKDVKATVNGVEYSNVIKMSLLQNSTFEGENTKVDSEYWFAKDVGPIKIISSNEGETRESILIDYIIKK